MGAIMAQLSLSHLGYRPDSPKTVTLCLEAGDTDFPDRIPFFIRQNCFRMERRRKLPKGFSERFPYPYDLLEGELVPRPESFFYQGELVRIDSRWGTFWQADFSDFTTPGSYQIEVDAQVSPPFMVADGIYDRLVRGYLTFMESQRCGCEVPGVHPACHLDDGIRDEDGSYLPVAGGWHDAGDFRKWLSLTLGNLEALTDIAEKGHVAFKTRAMEEMEWGNLYFHQMITAEGQVYEDVAGGSAPEGSDLNYASDWWFENHPGCYGDASDNRWTDNQFHSGDERKIRTTYNPDVQFAFVEYQLHCARIFPDARGSLCRGLAERAWKYGRSKGHDGRTLFLSRELLAALELYRTGSSLVGLAEVRALTEELMRRQETSGDGISGFFYEKDRTDGFRSVAYADQPVWALLRLIERQPAGMEDLVEMARSAVRRYCDDYLSADAGSNPFAYAPYGVFLHPENTDLQVFRDAGNQRGIRSFVPTFNRFGIVHGCGGVVMSHAATLAKAGALMDRKDWRALAEKQIQWSLGHNPLNRSLFTGIGYRQPVAYGFRVTQIPEGCVVGFIGRPDDTPYLEESFAIEWNTLEIWDVPYALAMKAIRWLL